VSQVEPEWSIVKIVTHRESGMDALFQVQWGTGDLTWLPYSSVKNLHPLEDYFEALGITRIGQLKENLAPDGGEEMEIASTHIGLPAKEVPSQNSGGWERYKKRINFASRAQRSNIPSSLSFILDSLSTPALTFVTQPLHSSTMVRQMQNICVLDDDDVLVWDPITRKLLTFDQKQVWKIFRANFNILNGRVHDDDFHLPVGYDHFSGAWNSDREKIGDFFVQVQDPRNPSGLVWKNTHAKAPMPDVNGILVPEAASEVPCRLIDGVWHYGRGLVVDRHGLLESQGAYDVMANMAFRWAMGMMKQVEGTKKQKEEKKDNKRKLDAWKANTVETNSLSNWKKSLTVANSLSTSKCTEPAELSESKPKKAKKRKLDDTHIPSHANSNEPKHQHKGKGKAKEKQPISTTQSVASSSAVTLDSELAQYFASHAPDFEVDELMDEPVGDNNDRVSLGSGRV
jgi:hypothetical protein